MKIALIYLLLISPILTAQEFQIQPPDDWVVPFEISQNDLTYANNDYSSTTLLLDRQVIHHQDIEARYIRTVQRVNNENALQDIGKIELIFHPDYEQMIVNSLAIYR
ncbi:MAG: hypothetical protein DWP95_13075, partial [Proteobacteria bacterium]